MQERGCMMLMRSRNEIEDWVVEEARFIIANKSTLRQAAKEFGLSKSTIHRDMRERLPKLNPSLYEKVGEVLNFNLAERHIRGGASTAKRWGEKCNV